MPILNRDDAVEVEAHVKSIFAATPDSRTNAIRRLFVETLDFDPASGQVSLAGAPAGTMLPDAAERVSVLDGVHVLYVPLNIEGTDRVRKAEVDVAARVIADQLGYDLLLVFTNTSTSQLHLILPKFEGARPTLRRMVVERDLPRRTAVQQVASIFWNHRDKGLISTALDQAFDVEPVTKEFFGEYKRIFENMMGAVSGFDEGEEEDKRIFVQTMFNRLMFVYFLSRKGWLRFDNNADYLNTLWQDYGSGLGNGNFYRDRFRPLFFSGLNNPNSGDLTEGLRTVIGVVPFLNGGLFEEADLDRRGGITVPDEAVRQVLEGLFDRFNFTVMESTPFDVEVAVDPEMLGKVFEELVTGRHDSGAYYTPRPVVSFMCRESLKGYLEGQDTGLETEAVARFVDHQDTEGIGVAQARRVAEALTEVTVVDPACGSGAYLLGMMQELIELQARLFNVTKDAKSLYDLKLEIIQRNLYGVDIDDFAVNIAMLRLWLSLAIDYEGETPEPLPNLDFKVICGDSLLGPDPSSGTEVQGTLGLDNEQVRRLGQLKGEYLRASSRGDKVRLRTQIAELNAGIREALNLVETNGTVNWRTEFAEVFATHRGFDVVIGNPPYVESRSSSISGSLKEEYRSRVQGEWGASLPRGSDLLMYFYPRSVKLLNDKGHGCFITQNAWLSTDYGQKFQLFSIGRFSFVKVIDTDTKFFAKTTGPNINAVISVFKRATLSEIEYCTADSHMVTTHKKSILAKNPLKWGHVLAMPSYFNDILTKLPAMVASTAEISFGQGVNVPKSELNASGATVDILVKEGGFVAQTADGKIGRVTSTRADKIPALIMPRGIGSRYYCTFNACKALSFSCVELYLPSELWESDTHYCLWAYLNSSFVWLFREITGRKNLGGGMLKAEASDMKLLPVGFDFDFSKEAKQVLEAVKGREPLPVWEEVYTKEHLLIDNMVAEYLNFSDDQQRIREDLIDQVRFRGNRSRT